MSKLDMQTRLLWRKHSAWLFCRLAQALWIVSAVLACLRLWPVAAFTIGNAVFAYLISRMNADMMRLIEDEPSVCFKDRTFYIVRRSIHCGHTFLVGLCHDDAHAEILAQCAGGEKFAVEGTTLLAWYQQAIGKELK
jgi:hypothetical protein